MASGLILNAIFLSQIRNITMIPSITDDKESAAISSPKRWTVGTLTYTAGGLVILFFWLLWGDFAWSMRDRSVPNTLQVLFKKYDASDTLIGVFMCTLPSLIGMFLGPIISYKSDRHRGRWGRRIPFLLIPTPIAFLSMIGLAFSPQIGTCLDKILGPYSPGANISIIFSLGLFWTLFEFAAIVAGSVFGGLVNDVVPQAIIGRFYGLFRAFSLIAGIIFNYWMFGHVETYYVWVFLGIGTLYGVGFTMMCLKVKEGDYPPVLEEEQEASMGFFAKVKIYFRECFGNSYYRCFFGACTLMGLAAMPFNLFSLFYAKSINMSLKTYGACLAATYVVSLTLAYPLGSLADKFHPLRVTIASILLYAIAMLLGGLYVHSAWVFGLALIAHGVLSGTYVTASASLGQRLLPRERFAELGSAGGIIGAISSAILAPVLGKVLDFSHHNYRLTFFMSAFLAAAAVIGLTALHRRFLALGGDKNYVAPR